MIDEGSLREDLYYRLRGVEIRLPALTDRREDILLIAHFDKSDSEGFMPEAIEALCAAPLPGNVRQLRNLVQGARGAAGDAPVGMLHLPMDQLGRGAAPQPAGTGAEGVPRGVPLREIERRAIVQAPRTAKATGRAQRSCSTSIARPCGVRSRSTRSRPDRRRDLAGWRRGRGVDRPSRGGRARGDRRQESAERVELSARTADELDAVARGL